eukprot:Lankesteria_metandrocarpae@DN1934_c0_g1_i1.p1
MSSAVLPLLRKMSQLRAVHAQCEEDQLKLTKDRIHTAFISAVAREIANWRIHVHITVEHATMFGETVYCVGGVQELGCWKPENGIEMSWSHGDKWFASVYLPCLENIQFKFVVKDSSDVYLWQPGRNHTIRLGNCQMIRAVVVVVEW